MGLIRACIAMLPRLQATESLLGMNVVALGSGSLEQHDAHALLARLSQSAFGRRRTLAKASPTELAGMGVGIGVTLVSK